MTNMIHDEMVEYEKTTKTRIVENMQLVGLALTIAGQVLVRFDLALTAQILWLVANGVALYRDFYLKRPLADKVKNAALLALTAALIVSLLFNVNI